MEKLNILSTSNNRFIRINEVVNKVGLGKSKIYDLVAQNEFPKQYQLTGNRSVAWLESEVDAWIVQKVIDARSAA